MREDNSAEAARKTTFLAGGVLELGWELCTWIPAVRRRSRRYDRTVIVGKPGFQYLYEDFADEYVEHRVSGDKDRWLCNGQLQKMPDRFVRRFRPDKIWTPTRKICYNRQREYFKYGGGEAEKYDIIIHARAMTKYGQSNLNYSPKKYAKLVRHFSGKRIACIGSRKGAFAIDGAEDLRGVPMKQLSNVLGVGKVCVGTSSGPMHLASMCGCPHVVLTGPEKLKSLHWRTNKDRYVHLWNPFNAPCNVVQAVGWKPPLKKVIEAVEMFV